MSQFRTFNFKKESRCGNAAKAGKGSWGRPRKVFNKKTHKQAYIFFLGYKNLTSNVQCITGVKTSLGRCVHPMSCYVIHVHAPGDVDYSKEPLKGIVRPHLRRWGPRHCTPKKAALWEGVLLFRQKLLAIVGPVFPPKTLEKSGGPTPCRPSSLPSLAPAPPSGSVRSWNVLIILLSRVGNSKPD